MAPYWLSAISGSYLCIRFCKWITLHSPENKPKRLFIYIGDHTFEIMALHFLAFKIVSLCIVYIYSLPIEQLAEFPVIFSYAQQGWWMAYLFIGIAVPLGYVYCKDAIIQTIYRQR